MVNWSSFGSPKNIMSIDASTNSIAFGIYESGKLIHYGKVNFSGKTIYKKVGDASRKVNAFMKEFEIDAIVIESAIHVNSQKSAISLSLVQGAILGAAQQNGVKDVVSCSPVAWQSWIGNNRLNKSEKDKIRDRNPGRSASWYKDKERSFRKQRTINYVNDKFNTNIEDDDVADAVALGWYSVNNWVRLTGEPSNA
jgi:Holliday junction resolvasome RuvABC endonuclease subunit